MARPENNIQIVRKVIKHRMRMLDRRANVVLHDILIYKDQVKLGLGKNEIFPVC